MIIKIRHKNENWGRVLESYYLEYTQEPHKVIIKYYNTYLKHKDVSLLYSKELVERFIEEGHWEIFDTYTTYEESKQQIKIPLEAKMLVYQCIDIIRLAMTRDGNSVGNLRSQTHIKDIQERFGV